MHWTSRFALTLVASVLSFAAAGQQPPSSPTVTNYEAPGNLESTHALGCISPDQILDTYTPADLYPAAAACIIDNRTEDGIYLYVVAGAYSRTTPCESRTRLRTTRPCCCDSDHSSRSVMNE